MPAPPPDARALRGRVESVERTGDDGALLRLHTETDLPPVRASRFFMLKREDGLSPLIPRPFSIYRQQGRRLEFILKVTGPGTRALAASRSGDPIRVVGPLGNGWPTLDGDGPPWVLLAGGIGIAPFYLAIEQALAGMDRRKPCRPDQLTLLFGAARRGLLYDLPALERLGPKILTATDDGSAGFHGNVLSLLEQLWRKQTLPRPIRILACGPHRMLHATERLARREGVEAWLSLETVMGCGVGICNGCPVPTLESGPRGSWPNAKCCVEGPVFGTHEISLEHAP